MHTPTYEHTLVNFCRCNTQSALIFGESVRSLRSDSVGFPAARGRALFAMHRSSRLGRVCFQRVRVTKVCSLHLDFDNVVFSSLLPCSLTLRSMCLLFIAKRVENYARVSSRLELARNPSYVSVCTKINRPRLSWICMDVQRGRILLLRSEKVLRYMNDG